MDGLGQGRRGARRSPAAVRQPAAATDSRRRLSMAQTCRRRALGRLRAAGGCPRRKAGCRGGRPPACTSFPCEQCGAVLTYAPGTTELACAYCGHRNQIAEARSRSSSKRLRRGPRARPGGEAPTDRRSARSSAAPCVPSSRSRPTGIAGPARSAAQPVVADTGAVAGRSSRRPCCRSPSTRPGGAGRLFGAWLQGPVVRAIRKLEALCPRPGTAARHVHALLDLSTAAPRTDYAGQRGDHLLRASRSTPSSTAGRRASRRSRCRRCAGGRPRGQVGARLRRRAGAGRRARCRRTHRGARAVGPAGPAALHAPSYLERLQRRGLPGPGGRGLRARPGDGCATPIAHGRPTADIGGDQQRIQRMEVDHEPRRPSSTCCCRSGSRPITFSGRQLSLRASTAAPARSRASGRGASGRSRVR